jgi:hypothetical protein
MNMNEKQYLIAYGTLTDGLTFLGPFKDAHDANDYASENLRHLNWEVAELHALPEEFAPPKLFRVVMPKAGGVPSVQFWVDDGETQAPDLRDDDQAVTGWLPFTQ